ncbi:hypothetical protein ABTZ57_19280 [Streptomyces sp. NPDC094048]|uniref:hypothetical protein n=1 Tax=Streptomyces sp. NPDC094048 TaxID=3155207 RepID=UPI00331B8BC2
MSTAPYSHAAGISTAVRNSRDTARPRGRSRTRSAARAPATRASRTNHTGRTITSTTIRTGILIRVVGQPSPASYRAGA